MTSNDIIAIIFFWVLTTIIPITAVVKYTIRRKKDNLLSVVTHDRVMEHWGKGEDLDPYTLGMTLIYVRKKIRRELND